MSDFQLPKLKPYTLSDGTQLDPNAKAQQLMEAHRRISESMAPVVTPVAIDMNNPYAMPEDQVFGNTMEAHLRNGGVDSYSVRKQFADSAIADANRMNQENIDKQSNTGFLSTANLESTNPLVWAGTNAANLGALAIGTVGQLGATAYTAPKQLAASYTEQMVPDSVKNAYNTQRQIDNAKASLNQQANEINQLVQTGEMNQEEARTRLAEINQQQSKLVLPASMSILLDQKLPVGQKVASTLANTVGFSVLDLGRETNTVTTYRELLDHAQREREYVQTIRSEDAQGNPTDTSAMNWANHIRTQRIQDYNSKDRDLILAQNRADQSYAANGVSFDWAKEKAKATGIALGNTLSQATPMSVVDTVVESAPYMAAPLATALAMGADQAGKGRSQWEARTGKALPSLGENAAMLGTDAVYTAANFLENKYLADTIAGKLKSGGTKSLGGAVLGIVTKPVTKVLAPAAVEGVSEGIQSSIESGLGNLNPNFDAAQVGMGIGLGALSGGSIGALATPGALVAGVAGALAATSKGKALTASNEAQQALDAISQADLLDPTKESYNPNEVIKRAARQYQANDATPESRTEAMDSAHAAMNQMTELATKLEEAMQVHVDTAKEREVATQKHMTAIANAEAEGNTALADAVKQSLVIRQAGWDQVSPEGKAESDQKLLDALNSKIIESSKLYDSLIKLDTNTAKTSNSDVVVNSEPTTTSEQQASNIDDSYHSVIHDYPTEENAVKAAKLAADITNGLTDTQRKALRAFSDAIVASNELKKMSTTTHKGVMEGTQDSATNFRGVSEYLALGREAIRDSKQPVFKALIRDLANFKDSHTKKLAAAIEAKAKAPNGYAIPVLKSGKDWVLGEPVHIRDQTKEYQKEVRKNGGLLIHKESEEIIHYLTIEVDAINKTEAALNNINGSPKEAVTKVEPVVIPEGEADVVVSPTVSTEEVTLEPVVEDVITTQVQEEVDATKQKNSERPKGGLTLFNVEGMTTQEVFDDLQPKTLEDNNTSNTGFQKVNLVLASFYQRVIKDSWNSPLVTVKDFITKISNEDLVVRLVEKATGKPATDKQIKLMEHFSIFANKQRSVLEGLIRKDVSNDSKYTNYLSFLINEDGSIDENLTTALSLATYSYIAEEGSKFYNDSDTISKMLGLKPHQTVPWYIAKNFTTVGIARVAVINSLGNSAYKALQLKLDKKVSVERKEKLIAALGSLAYSAMVDQHLVQVTNINSAYIDQAKAHSKMSYSMRKESPMTLKPNDPNGAYNAYVRISHNTTVNKGIENTQGLVPVNKAIVDSNSGTNGLLARVFGLPNTSTAPLTSPPKGLVQKALDTLGTEIPNALRSRVSKMMKKEYRVSPELYDHFKTLYTLDQKAFYEMLGLVSDEKLNSMHVVARTAQKSVNNDIIRSVSSLFETVDSLEKDSNGEYPSLYLPMKVWSVNRVGVTSNMLNEQGNKIHRAILGMKSHKQNIDYNLDPLNEKGLPTQYGRYLLAIAANMEDAVEAFTTVGKTPDKTTASNFLPSFIEYLDSPTMASYVTAMTKVQEGNPSKSDLSLVQEAISDFGMGALSLNALHNITNLMNAKKDGTELSTDISFGSDGVNNGVILSNLLYGTAEKSLLSQGGIFLNGDTTTTAVGYLAQGDTDYYTDIANTIKSYIEESMKDVQEVAKKLNVPNSIVMGMYGSLAYFDPSFGKRKGAKAAAIPFNYGSGFSSIKASVTREVIKGIYSQIEKVASGELSASVVQEQLNNLLGSYAPVITGMKPSELLEVELTSKQEGQIYKVDALLRGSSVESALTELNTSFMAARSKIINSSQFAGSMFGMVYNIAEQAKLEELKDAGKLPIRKGANGNSQVLEGLTSEQQAELMKELAPYVPVIKSCAGVFSSNGKESGIPTFSLERTNTGAYTNTFTFTRTPSYVYTHSSVKPAPIAKGKVSRGKIKQEGKEWTVKPVGVGITASITQSTDANITTVVSAKHDATNHHDENSTGIDQVIDMANTQNQTVWDSVSKYHVYYETVLAVRDSLKGIIAYAKTNTLNSEEVNELVDQLTKLNPLDPTVGLNYYVEGMTNGDLAKLKKLIHINSINQYGTEGGEILITEAMRKELLNETALHEKRIKQLIKEFEVLNTELESIITKGYQTGTNKPTLSKKDIEGNPHNILTVTGKHTEKDQVKASRATKFIGRGSSTSSTNQYAKDLVAIANTGDYSNQDYVFISAEGNRTGRLKPDYAEIDEALAAGATILTDLRVDRAREYNIGERDVASYLKSKSYFEVVDGRWVPSSRVSRMAVSNLLASNLGKRVSTTELFNAIQLDSKDANYYEPMLALFKQIIPKELTVTLVDTEELPSHVKPDRPLGLGRAINNTSAPEIWVNRSVFDGTGVSPFEVVMHEMVHIATTMATTKEHLNSNPEAKEAVARIEKLMKQVKTRWDKEGESNSGNHFISDGSTEYPMREREVQLIEYALGDVNEFIAVGLTNGTMIKYIDNIRTPLVNARKLEVPSVFQSFIKEIYKLLTTMDTRKGTNPEKSTTILEALIYDFAVIADANSKIRKGDSQVNDYPEARTEKAITQYTAGEVFDVLPKGNLSTEFGIYLKGLVSTIVDNSFSVLEGFSLTGSNSKNYTPLQVWEEKKALGLTQYTTQAISAGFVLEPKEIFTIEALEVSLRAAMTSGFSTPAYRDLRIAYEKARTTLTAESFHKGDWSKASYADKALAQDKYRHLFSVFGTKDKEYDYMSRFLAMSLGSQEVRDLLKFPAYDRKKYQLGNKQSLNDTLISYMNAALNWVYGYLTKTLPTAAVNRKLPVLAQQLVSIDHSMRDEAVNGVFETMHSMQVRADEWLKVFGSKAASLLDGLTNTSKPTINATAKATQDVLNGKVMDRIELLREWRNTDQPNTKLGWKAELLNELADPNKAQRAISKLIRRHTLLQERRKTIIDRTTVDILNTFEDGGKYLTPEMHTAITYALLRTNANVLIPAFGTDGLLGFLGSETKREAAIIKLIQSIGSKTNGNLMINRAHDLAYYQVTNDPRVGLTKNTLNIARGVGTHNVLEESDVDKELVAELDQLTALMALRHSNSSHLSLAHQVAKKEFARKGGNGISSTLSYHESMNKEATNTLFEGNSVSQMQGYVPDLTNPRREIRVVGSIEEGKKLERIGYKLIGEVRPDTNDIITDGKRYLYFTEAKSQQRYVTGATSLTSTARKGSSLIRGNETNSDTYKRLAAMNTKTASLLNEKSKQDPMIYNPAKGKTSTVPNYANDGSIMDYSYEMKAVNRDAHLQRSNQFAHLLGAYTGSTFDKVNSPEHNRTVFDALYKNYVEDYAKDSKAFVDISPNSKDPELREIYAMLPADTKNHVKSLWGAGNSVWVRAEVVTATFGYHKYTLGSIFDKESKDRNPVEGAISQLALSMFGNEAKLRTMKAEELWQYLAGLMKSAVVIRNATTFVGNQVANFAVLNAMGVLKFEAIKEGVTAMRAATQYRKDMVMLLSLEQRLRARVGNLSEMQNELNRVKDSINKNPLKDFLEAGMLPTIVEDVSLNQDEFSYGSRVEAGIEANTTWVPKLVKDAVKHAVVHPSTPLFKFLANATQMSDFTSKYVLYKHAMTKLNMNHDQALDLADKMFIAYDVPTSKGMQYANDMGFIMFSKYAIRIQRAMMYLLKEHPAGALGQAGIAAMMNSAGALDPIAVANLGVPFSSSILGLPSAMLEPLPIKLVLGLF